MTPQEYKELLLTGEYNVEKRGKNFVVTDPSGCVCSVTNSMEKAVQRIEEVRKHYGKINFRSENE